MTLQYFRHSDLIWLKDFNRRLVRFCTFLEIMQMTFLLVFFFSYILTFRLLVFSLWITSFRRSICSSRPASRILQVPSGDAMRVRQPSYSPVFAWGSSTLRKFLFSFSPRTWLSWEQVDKNLAMLLVPGHLYMALNNTHLSWISVKTQFLIALPVLKYILF